MKESRENFWLKLELLIPWEIEESLIWRLKSLGIDRFSIERSPENYLNPMLFIWVDSNQYSEHLRNTIEIALTSIAESFGENLSAPKWEKVEDEDWSISWKLHWKPDPVGERLLVLPAWLELPEAYKDRIVIRLDPGSAFGTGSHPTTRLCLEALDRNPPSGLKVADVGCGSGLLGMAALGLGAMQVIAVDIDSLAVKSTLNNASFNQFSESKIRVSLGSIDALKNQLKNDSVDIVLCNILAPVIKTLIPGFRSVLKQKGRVLLSGVLVNQLEEMTKFLDLLGWQLESVYQLDQWVLLEAFTP